MAVSAEITPGELIGTESGASGRPIDSRGGWMLIRTSS